MEKRVYCAIGIGHVEIGKILAGREGLSVVSGVDVGKLELRVVLRWSDGRFERPWRISNPGEIPQFIRMLVAIGRQHQFVVAMEPTGTYGDALRQALADERIELQQVSGKRAHDYAEETSRPPRAQRVSSCWCCSSSGSRQSVPSRNIAQSLASSFLASRKSIQQPP